MTVSGGASKTMAPGTTDTPITKLSLGRRLLARQELTLIGVLILVGVLATLRNSSFGASDNLLQVIRAAVVTFIVACPLTLVTIGGGFDFSVGSVFTLGGVSAAYFMTHGIIWPLAIVLGIAVGAVIGGLNAVTIDRLRVPPIITTLGTFYFMSGVVILFTHGIDIAPLPTQFNSLGTGSTLGVPNVILAGILVGIAYHLVLERTRFGYNVRSLGGNRLAATENGIPVRRLDAWLYVGAGALAAFAGIVYAARTGSGQVSAAWSVGDPDGDQCRTHRRHEPVRRHRDDHRHRSRRDPVRRDRQRTRGGGNRRPLFQHDHRRDPGLRRCRRQRTTRTDVLSQALISPRVLR